MDKKTGIKEETIMLGLDPAKIAAMQETSKHIKGVIRVDYKESTVSLKLSSTVPEAEVIIPDLASQLAGALAQQLQAFFAIEGEIIETNKPDEL